MEELELFVQEIENLCCIIEEGASVRELLDLGKHFVDRANAMLKRSLDTLEESELDALISEGNSLRIELHQMHQLQQRLKQVRWYQRAQGMRNGSSKLTYNDIKSLLSAVSDDICPADPIIDKEIRKLQEIGAIIEAWEKQASKYFRGNIQQHELTEIEQFLKTAADIEGQVPSYTILKDALRKAKEWLRSVKQLQDNDHFPYCHTLEAIVQKGANIPIQLEELSRMQGHLQSAQEWKQNTAAAFLKKHTFYTLLEVLMPRAEPVTIDSDLKTPFKDDFVKEMNPHQIVDSFKMAEDKELRDMRELRRINMAKNPLRDEYCLCKSNFTGVMFNCQLCRDWFHEDCVPPPAHIENCNGSSTANLLQKPKWLCPSCVRSKRPRLETILPLLVSLQRLPIRLPEDEALRCLAERAMNWQDRARKALTSPDVTAALEAIQAQQRKHKRKSAALGRKIRRGSNRNSKDHDMSSGSLANNSDAADTDDDEEGRLHIVEEGLSGEENEEEGLEEALAVAAAELQKLLSDSETENLAELMMEGDLLEVSLDESHELWRILSAVQPACNSEAAEMVKQVQRQQKLHPPPPSSLNSAAEDSNDSLLVQSSPNSNNGSLSGRQANAQNSTTTGGNKKRRSLDPATGCPVPRKKTSTPNKQPPSAKKAGRKSDASKQNAAAEENAENNFTPTKQQSTNGNASAGNSSQKKRKRMTGNNAAAAGNTAGNAAGQKNSQRAQMAQQEDDEEECRAENCRKPTGREVDWVQCDGGCNEWFHMFCVGLNRNQIKDDVDYICQRCSKTSTGVTSGPGGTVAIIATSLSVNSSATAQNNTTSAAAGSVGKGRSQAAR